MIFWISRGLGVPLIFICLKRLGEMEKTSLRFLFGDLSFVRLC